MTAPDRQERAPSLLAAVASGNEGKMLLPVVEELRGAGVLVTLRDLGSFGSGNSRSWLRTQGYRTRSVLLSEAVAPLRAAGRYDGLLLGNDTFGPTRALINAFSRVGRPTFLIEEGITANTEEHTHSPASVISRPRRAAAHLAFMALQLDFAGIYRRASDSLSGATFPTQPYGTYGVDRFFVASPLFPTNRRAENVDVVATGLPGFNGTLLPDIEALPRTSKVVILTSPLYRHGVGDKKQNKAFWADVVRGVEQSAGVEEIVLRPHPLGEAAADYAGLESLARISTNSERVEDALDGAGACVAVASTALLQAALSGVPGVTVGTKRHFGSDASLWPSEYLDCFYRAADPRDLPQQLESIDLASFRHHVEAIQRTFGLCFDGQASTRIASSILELLQMRRARTAQSTMDDSG